jgi:hypothetical protein
VAANVYNEVIQVEVRDQSAAALTSVQKNVTTTETMLNRISRAPYAVVVKATDLLTRPLAAMVSTAEGIVRKGLMLPVTLMDKATAPLRGIMNSMGGVGSIMQGIGQGVGMTAIGLVAQGFGMVKGAIIDMNATLETSTLQFETLMGNADEARAHVQDLFEFAKKTPFEAQPVIDASRMLRTFGGAALDTMDNLTLFGNASAATNADIKEVSFWFGRAYAAIKAGQPFGEARMRLQELAILSPEATQKLEALEKAGAKGDVVWNEMTKDLGRFNGAMDKQASTWEGLTSTLSDSIRLTSAKVFQPLFKVAKNAVSALNDVLSSDAFNAWADSFGKTLADVVQSLGDAIGVIKDFGSAIGTAFTTDKGAIGVVYDLIKKVFGQGVADFLNPFLNGLMKFIPTLQQVARWIGYAFQDLKRGDFKNFGRDLVIAFQQLTGIDLSGVFDAILAAFDTLGTAIDWMRGTAWPALQTAMGAVMSFIVVEVVPKLADLFNWLWPNVEAAFDWATKTAWPALQQAMMDVVGHIQNDVIPWLGNLGTAVEGNGEKVQQQDKPWRDFGAMLAALGAAMETQQHTMDQYQRILDNIGRTLVVVFGIKPDPGTPTTASFWDDILQPLADAARAFLGLQTAVDNFVTSVANFSDSLPNAVKAWEEWTNQAWTAFEGLVANWDTMIASWKATGVQDLIALGRDIINGLISGMASVDLGGWLTSNVTNKIPDVVKQAMGIHSPSAVMADIGSNMMQGLINGLTSRLPDILSFMGNLSNVFGGTDVGGWISAAIQATGVPSAWAGPLSQIIQYESGGNPAAANLTDINAQNGDPSVGLMQLTGSNRAHYTPPGMNPLDPIAQIIAGIRYIQDRYGDISNVPGVRSLAGGGAYVPYDAGGVLPPGVTVAANNTGANEFVMTPGQIGALGGSGLVFAPVFNIDAPGASAGAGEEISSAIEEQASQMFAMLGTQLRVAFGNLAVEGGAT